MNAPFLDATLLGNDAANTLGRATWAACERSAGAFSTPWHVCVHGLGLETGTVSAPFAPLLRLSELLVERSYAEPLACVVHELLQLLSSHDESAGKSAAMLSRTQRVASLLAGIGEAETRAGAVAAALHVLTYFGGTSDSVIREHVRNTLGDLNGASPVGPRQRYQTLCASVQLLHAAQQAASTQCVREELALQFEEVLERASRLEHRFDAKRIQAVLLAVQARGAGQQQTLAWLDHLAQLLTECAAVRGPLPQDDAIHSGLDFILFPLALMLEAAAQTTHGCRLALGSGATHAALYLLEQLLPASRVSQLAFLVGPLITLGAVPLAELQQRADGILQEYLRSSAGSDADAYLRSTYAIYTGGRLGCAEGLPKEVFTRLEQALLVRGRPASGYFSLPMVAAYTLYSSCVAPAAHRALPDPETLTDVLASRLPNEPVPAGEARKLSHALLYLGLTRHAGRLERCPSNAVHEVAV